MASRALLGGLSASLLQLAFSASPAMAETTAALNVPRVLLNTLEIGYYHESIPVARKLLVELGPKYGINIEITDDAADFNDDNLAQYDALLFVLNNDNGPPVQSDEILDDDQQAALARYFQKGGAFAGVHSASACLFNDVTYANELGAFFDFHPSLQPAEFINLDSDFPATAHLPDVFTYTEEVYSFTSDPRSVGATVILTVNESSYVHDGQSTGNFSQGSPHPIAWQNENPTSAYPLASGAAKAGRSFYTSLGHLNTTWEADWFQQHVMEGLKWALDGASTLAYGVGLVGNGTVGGGGDVIQNATATAASSSSSGSGSSSSSGSSTSTSTGVVARSGVASGSSTASGASATSAAASSGAAGRAGAVQAGGAGTIGAVLGGVVAGMAGVGLVL